MTKRDSTALPTQADFDPWGDLDAQWAWRNFGGLTLDQAHAKFQENPLWYQEDFMFMGLRAFAYYFPVIDHHLRNVPENHDGGDDHQAWILAHAIMQQFEVAHLPILKTLAPAIRDLAAYVQQMIHRFGTTATEQMRVADAWKQVMEQINAIQAAE